MENEEEPETTGVSDKLKKIKEIEVKVKKIKDKKKEIYSKVQPAKSMLVGFLCSIDGPMEWGDNRVKRVKVNYQRKKTIKTTLEAMQNVLTKEEFQTIKDGISLLKKSRKEESKRDKSISFVKIHDLRKKKSLTNI